VSEVEIQQQTTEWLKFRSTRIGASEAPIIMGDSPWSTPRQLWEQKAGLRPPSESNFATNRGNRFEPVARSLYELETGLELPAKVLVHPRYNFIMASLDGCNDTNTIICEIKIAGAEVLEQAKKGIVHQKYFAQVQHQLEVTGAKENHFFVCYAQRNKITGEDKIVDTALVKAKRDDEYIKTLIEKECEFYRYMIEKTPPPLQHDDVLVVNDREAYEIMAAEEFDKQALIKFCFEKYNHTNFDIAGARLSQNKNGVWTLRG
jgi:putative phage-type endonuclease